MGTTNNSRPPPSRKFLSRAIAGLRGTQLLVGCSRRDATDLCLAHAKLYLTDDTVVVRFFAEEHPEYVFLAVAKVGGILANNTRNAEYIKNSLAIQAVDSFNEKKLLSI